jgi:hypothetical protein
MSGRKTWAADDVLTAEDLNDYLMDQAVMVFASAGARDGAILSPTQGMMVYLTDVNKFQQYSGSAWVGFNSEYAAGVKIFGGTATPTADPNATLNLWFN